MLKRLAALLFIFVLAAQVLAGVCVCLDGDAGGGKDDSHAKMSCCKRQKSVRASVSPTACCDAPCGAPAGNGNNLPRSQSESSVKIPAPVLAAVEKLIISLNFRPTRGNAQPLISKRAGETPLKSAHPPNLYLQNHAFLI